MKRRTGFILIAAACVSLAVASTAYACASLATLYLDRETVRPGTWLNVEGRNYANTDPTNPLAAKPVTIRLDSRTGRIVASNVPVANRRIKTSFRIPNVRPGYHTLLATQFRSDGKPLAGTPGRASIKVLGAGAAAAAPWGGKPGGTGGASPAVGNLPSPVTLGGFLLALALAGSGVLALAGARTGRRPGPAPATA